MAWLCEELGELAQAVRKGTPEQQLHELGDVLAWLASLANQLGLSLEDAVGSLRHRSTTPLNGPSACLSFGLTSSATGQQHLGDLDRVERGALAEVVA